MPIFDEGLNMKGVVRVAACWSTSFPRRVKVTLQGVQDLPEDQEANEVACRVVTKSGMVQATPSKFSLMAGCADLKSVGLDQLEMQDEQDRLTVEVLVYGKEDDFFSSLYLARRKSRSTLTTHWNILLVCFAWYLIGLSGQPEVFGRADITLPAEGPPKDEAVAIAGGDGQRPAIVHLKTSWVE
jgi:hypothetical protein